MKDHDFGESYVVLYKRGDAVPPIELPLSLTVVLGGFGMVAPVGLLIIGMFGAPLLPAVQHHLGIHRVGLNLAPVVIGPAVPLALRLATNTLLEPVRGWMKTSLAVRTAMKCGKAQCACAFDATKRHGPHFELTYKANGKTVNVKLGSVPNARFSRFVSPFFADLSR